MVSTETLEALEHQVWTALAGVRDPEIPPCSITDLGIVERIRVTPDALEVDLLPTFAGCPALDVIREDAEAALRTVAGDRAVLVRFVYSPAWTSAPSTWCLATCACRAIAASTCAAASRRRRGTATCRWSPTARAGRG